MRLEKMYSMTDQCICMLRRPYHDDGITGSDGKEVGTGDCLWALPLQLGLDGVNDLEAPERVGVGHSRLLANEKRLVVQKNGAITTLTTD